MPNPFYLGHFEGVRLRRARLIEQAGLCLGIIACVAVIGYLAGGLARSLSPRCTVTVIDGMGDAYVAGSGDTIEQAYDGIVLPRDAVGWKEFCR